MNNSVNSNIYAFDAIRVLEMYSDYVRGNTNCTIVVVSKRDLCAAAADAICKSSEKLGFGKDACAWVKLETVSAAAGELAGGTAGEVADATTDETAARASGELMSSNLREIVEGIDPISIIVTDSDSADAVARSYEINVDYDAFNRANGRTLIAFKDFESMLHDAESKQAAWRLFKKMQPV